MEWPTKEGGQPVVPRRVRRRVDLRAALVAAATTLLLGVAGLSGECAAELAAVLRLFA